MTTTEEEMFSFEVINKRDLSKYKSDVNKYKNIVNFPFTQNFFSL